MAEGRTRARDNPFATSRVLALRWRPREVGWEPLLGRLAALGHRAAIVGPEGSGKTTLLEDLAPRLAARGFQVRFLGLRPGGRIAAAQERSLLGGLGERDFLLLDAADELPPLAWARLRRRAAPAGGLVVTLHRAGRLPTLLECAPTPGLLAELVRDLLEPAEFANLEPGLPDLFRRHRGNLRTALRELYDVWAAR